MRIKVKSAASTKVLTIDDDITYEEFVAELEQDRTLFPLGEKVASVKKGFPPKAVSVEGSIKEVIKSGDQLIVETGTRPGPVPEQGSSGSKLGTSESNTGTSGPNTGTSGPDPAPVPGTGIPHVNLPHAHLILRNIPDDNSCMFNAIVYAMKSESVEDLRAICAAMIKSDPEKYSEIVLGKSNQAYSDWIKRPNSWGGAIELGILSSYLQVRINCIDIELGTPIVFEDEDTKPHRFINLIYSGIHYDLVVLNPSLAVADKANDQSMWELEGEERELVQEGTRELVGKLQSGNYTTNTTTFRLRCLECYSVLVGERGASKHAEETGHMKYGETS